MTQTLTVRFTTCNSDHDKRETRVRERETLAETIQAAVERVYGRGRSWWADSGLGLGYGQIVRGGNCETYRLRVDIETRDGVRLL